MRYFQTLPTDNAFFKTYAKIAKGIQASTYFTQVVSALTESVIIYSLLFTTLSFLLSPIQAQVSSLVGAILGTLILEIGLRFFLPHSIDAFLYKRKEGLYLAMSIFIIGMTITLIFSSGYLSFIGSKSYIKNNAPTLTPMTTALIDSTHQVDRDKQIKSYQIDSTTIANNAAQLIEISEKSYNSAISERQTVLSTLPKKSNESWGSWTARKNAIKAEIKQIEAERDAKTALLTTDKIEKLKALKTANVEQLATFKNSHNLASLDIENSNTTAQNEIDQTAEQQGTGLGWITIIFLIYFIVCTTIERIHKKGSGIEETPIPTDYYFRASVLGEAVTALSERFNQITRQRIADFQAATAPPPQPIEPHHLLSIAGFEQQSYNLNFGSNTAPPLPTGNTDNIEDATILEEQITSYVEASVTLEENNLHDQAKEMKLKAKEVIKTYLQRDGSEPTKEQIQALESKVFEFVNHVTTVNPFTIERQQIGFKINNTNQSKSTPNGERITVNVGDTKKRNCIHCKKLFSYKHWNKKYCSDDCRIKAWEMRTGKKFGKKKVNDL